MKNLKYFYVSNNNDGFGSLRGNFSSEEEALKQLPKSTVFHSQIRWDHEHHLKKLLPDFKNHAVSWDEKENGVKDIELSVDNNKVLYKAQLKVVVSNNEVTPEIKEEGKPYQAQSTKRVDEQELYISVEGHLNGEWITINLDGIPTHRGAIVDENGKEFSIEESDYNSY